MENNIALQIISFIYVFVLSIVYFTKRKYNFVESKIYRYLLIISMVELILDILKVYTGFGLSEKTIIIISKLQGISLFVWLIMFAFYALLSRSNNKYESFKSLLKAHTSLNLWVILAVLMFTVLVILQFVFNFLHINRYADEIEIVYILGIVISLIVLINLLFNNKNIAKYKNYSILASIVMLLIVNVFQFVNNNMPIMSCGICLVTLFQYFTMENPDLKYIDELNALKDRAEAANAAKTDFLASMSHEIRTPMNAIIGLSETLLNSRLPEEFRDDVKSINEAGNTLLEIVNNILDITKVEAGKMELNNAPYNLADTIAKLSHIAKVSVSERPIVFTTEINGNIPKELMGDETKVYQILMNILSNAIKYTKKGSIKFIVNSVVSGNVVNLTFKVSDTGIGIKKADNQRLFEEFQRLDQEKSDIQGSGLGLVITKKLVDLMGGKISFESVYQQGTTFTVELQQSIVDKTQIDMATYESKKVSVGEYFDGSEYKILLVDDNLLNLKVAEKLLKNYNFQITSVKSGLECLNYTKHNKYDLVLMDHMMPEMDGIHTLYNLKKRAAGFDTPVVVLTANAIEGSKEMYLREGFVDYLSKPIDQVELDRVLREQLKIDDDGNSNKVNSNSFGISQKNIYANDNLNGSNSNAVSSANTNSNVTVSSNVNNDIEEKVVQESNPTPSVAPIFPTESNVAPIFDMQNGASNDGADANNNTTNETNNVENTIPKIFSDEEINK